MKSLKQQQAELMARFKARSHKKKVCIHIFVPPEVKKARTLEIVGDIYMKCSISDAAVKKFRQQTHKTK